MRLSDAGLRRHPTKLIHPNHQLPPWLALLREQLSQPLRILRPNTRIRIDGYTWIHAQQSIAEQARMHMQVHMRHLLERGRSNRMPQAHALIGEGLSDGSGDSYQCVHQPRASSRVKVAYIVHVFPRHDQYVTRIVLTRIDKGDRQIILVDDVARCTTPHNLAEDAFGTQICSSLFKSL